MFAAQRRRLLLERLESSGWASTADLAGTLAVSQVTVRRDLETLQSEGLVQRQRGGARLVRTSTGAESESDGGAGADRSRIARVALELVDDGDAVLLGAGPEVAALARLLVVRRGLTVVTNSFLVAEALVRGPRATDVVLTGGSLDGASMSLVGAGAEQSLLGLRARRAFLAGSGLTAGRGLSDSDLPVAAMHRAVAEAAGEVVVLASSAVVGRDGLFQTVPPDRVGHLVTDSLEGAVLDPLRRAGTTVHLA